MVGQSSVIDTLGISAKDRERVRFLRQTFGDVMRRKELHEASEKYFGNDLATAAIVKNKAFQYKKGSGLYVLSVLDVAGTKNGEASKNPEIIRIKERAVTQLKSKTQEKSILDGVEHPEPGEDIRKPWSSIEVKATVSDYFDMLRAELEGTPYSKTAQRNALLKRLPKRSAQAVESKHCNISAVLRDMKLTYIAGYKPRGNYQDLLAETVEDYLVANPEPRKEIVELDADPVDAPPDGSKFVMADIEVPPPQPTEARRKSPIKAFKTDWGAVTAHSRKLGEQGERFVLELERRRLRDAGQLDLEPKIEWVSQTRGDGAGYDIKSFDSTGTEILIEVKTTKGLATDTDCFVANSQTAA